MNSMDINLTNYAGIRERKNDNRKDWKTAEAQREKRAENTDDRRANNSDLGIHADKITLDISPDSQEFMSRVAERKAAQAEEQARLEAENPWSPFDYRGDLSKNEPTQYLVFSKYLYDNGFFNDMDDEQAGRMEDMLKNITAGMDSIRGPLDAGRWDNSMSHEAAKLDLVSSVNALNYFADTYVSENMRDSFKELIKEYENYNSKIVANHRNSMDLYSDSMKHISAPNATGVSAEVKQSQERTRAYQQIGKVTHTEQEEKGLREDYQLLFDKLMNKQDSAKNIFDSMQNLLVNYASGGSKNNAVLSLLNANNAGSIDNMFRYWTALL